MTAHPRGFGADPHIGVIRPVPLPTQHACAECV